jgi:hypothetical protein
MWAPGVSWAPVVLGSVLLLGLVLVVPLAADAAHLAARGDR